MWETTLGGPVCAFMLRCPQYISHVQTFHVYSTETDISNMSSLTRLLDEGADMD